MNSLNIQCNSHLQVKEWNAKLRKESYALDRQIRSIRREEEKITKSLKEAAKKNDKQVCSILAKEVVRSRKAVNRIYASKAQLSSVQLQMSHQLGESLRDLEIFFSHFAYTNFIFTTPTYIQYPHSNNQSVGFTAKIHRSDGSNATTSQIARDCGHDA